MGYEIGIGQDTDLLLRAEWEFVRFCCSFSGDSISRSTLRGMLRIVVELLRDTLRCFTSHLQALF
jgi:hypothetical protein